MKFFLLLVLLIIKITQAHAVEDYQLNGSFEVAGAPKKDITFILKWKEVDGKATGTYSDNFYTDAGIVRGISGELGRIFVVTFPNEIKGVRTISFLGPDLKGSQGSALIPFSVVLRDENGKPILTKAIEANLTGLTETRVAQREEEGRCREGFGALAGYCGMYRGMMTEESDTQTKCNLLGFNSTQLVMDENAELGLALGESSSFVATPVHRIGRLFTDIDSNRVDLLSRSCRPLPGTTFNGDDCKRLGLSGTFSVIKGVKHFSGNYSITDEKTNEMCRYSLSMNLI